MTDESPKAEMSIPTSALNRFEAEAGTNADKHPAITARPLSVHEASHAVAGICLGRADLLEWVSIVETSDHKGACKWDLENHVGMPGEDFAVGFAGPLGQVLFLPESFGAEISEFRLTIHQPRERLEKWGAGGWLSTDLVPFRTLVPHYPFTQGESSEKLTLRVIESRMRELLNRLTVATAIKDLALKLEAERKIDGKIAEKLIQRHLVQSDFVERSFLLL